jgi:hypothetical protein
MSATGQGAQGGEGAAAATQGQGEGQGQQGPDLSALAATLGQQGQTLEEMRTFLAGNPWQPQATQETQQQGGDEMDLSWLDEQMAIDPAAANQRLTETIDQRVDQRAQALVAPVIQQQTEMRHNQEARDLAAEFPEIATPEMAEKLAGRGGIAEQAAIALGAPHLAAEPKFWRIAYMAHKAAESANQEGSGDPGAVTLESGNGASPGPTAEDLKKAIMNSGDGLGARVLNF